MAEKIRIMIVDDVVESQKNLARLLSFEPDMEVVGFASTGTESLEEARKLNPHVILMDINMPDMDGISATEILTKSVPARVIMISVQSDRDYMRRAMQAGAVDFLAKPPSAEELYATVRQAYAKMPTFQPVAEGTKRENVSTNVTGKIVVVYSPQGGSGVTTIAVNLATGLMSADKRALIVDANLQFGDVVVHLDRPNERNIVDLSQAADVLDEELIQNVVIQHDSGLNILASPKFPQEAELVVPQNLGKVVQYLADTFDYVVVDTSLHLDEATLTLFDIADLVLFVGLPMIPAAKNLRLVIDLLTQIEFNTKKAMFVVNRVPQDRKAGAIDAEQIANYIKLPLVTSIPQIEKSMYESLTRGVPVITVNPKQSPGKEMRELADKIKTRLMQVPQEEGEEDEMPQKGSEKKRGRFG